MANVNKLERTKLEIERTKSAIESQQSRLRVLKDRLEKEKEKEVLRMVKENGLEPEQLSRLLKGYAMRINASLQRKEEGHASDSANA